MNRLDQAFRDQRLTLLENAQKVVGDLWVGRTWTDRDSFIRPATAVAEGGIAQTAHLVAAYFGQQTRNAHNDPQMDVGVVLPTYSVESLRGVPADEVYARPFGVLGFALASGREFVQADLEARAFAELLVSDDLQLAMQRASQDWIEAWNAQF